MYKIAKKLYKFFFKPNIKTPYKCSICSSDNISFKPLAEKYLRIFDKVGFVHSIFLFETLNIFGYSCSKCNSADRDRMYGLYFKDFLVNKDLTNFQFLDIAPARHLSDFLLKYLSKSNYRTADLLMDGVDDKVDIQDMLVYENNSKDFVLCSHVLEHVENDIKALEEIYRILKPGGKAILMAPINLGLETSIEADLNKTYTDEERWKYFGQNDHQRLYAKVDYINRIESVGFKLKQLGCDHFGKQVFETYGINVKSVLYIGEKV